MLFLVRQRREAMFLPDALKKELWGDPSRGIRGYPLAHKGEIELALAEAWTWLMVQGLVLPAEGMNGNNGDRRLSRRAYRMESEAEFASFKSPAAATRNPSPENRRYGLARLYARD